MHIVPSVFHLNETSGNWKMFIWGSWEEECCAHSAFYCFQGTSFNSRFLAVHCYQTPFKYVFLIDSINSKIFIKWPNPVKLISLGLN